MAVGWLGNLFILVGILFVAYKHRCGFIFGIIGNSLWCLKGIYTYQLDLISIEIVISLLQAFSWWNWGNEHVGTNSGVHARATKQQ